MWVVEPTVMAIAELPDPGAGIVAGLNLTVVPGGMPAAERLTELLKRPLITVVMVEVPRIPCMTLREVGEAETENPAEPVTVNVTVTLFRILPPFPVTMMG
jgi:hypothetical protein